MDETVDGPTPPDETARQGPAGTENGLDVFPLFETKGLVIGGGGQRGQRQSREVHDLVDRLLPGHVSLVVDGERFDA
jgi:hypothetical protein